MIRSRRFAKKLPRTNIRAVGHEQLEARYMLADPVGSEFQVNTYTTNNQFNAAIAADSGGDFVVVWQSTMQDGDADGIFGQLYSAGGTRVGNEFTVNSATTGSQQLPSVAMDADGDFVVTWQGPSAVAAELTEVWARRYNAAGLPQGVQFRVNTTTASNQQSPSVGMDNAGNFVIVWASGLQDGANYGVYAQRFNAAGAVVGTEFRVNTYTTSSQFMPVVAMDDDGDFVVAWQSLNQVLVPGPPQVIDANLGIFAQRFDETGTEAGMEFHVNTYTTNSQRMPAIAIDADGDFAISWESVGQDGSSYGVYAQLYDELGTAVGTEFRVNETTTMQQRLPSVSMADAGGFVVAWASNQQDGAGYGIYTRTFSAAGVPTSGEVRANTFTTGTQFNPAVAMDADGDFIVAWHSGDNQDGNSYGVFAQRFGGEETGGPEVLSGIFIWQDAPQRIEVQFNTDVSASLSNADITLENLTTMTTIDIDDIVVTYAGASNTATFTFPTLSFGALPDGNYRATLLASGITDGGGNPLPADYIFEFFFLMADGNHDRIVNLVDYNILASNFAQTPRPFTQGDFSYDNRVNLVDYNLLAQQFAQSIPQHLARAAGSFAATVPVAQKSNTMRSQLRDMLD